LHLTHANAYKVTMNHILYAYNIRTERESGLSWRRARSAYRRRLDSNSV